MHKIYRFNEDRKGFGKKLKELMIANGYTVESLSYSLDEGVLTSVNTIKKWRSGERIPDIDTIHKLAKKFNVTMQELYMPNSFYDNLSYIIHLFCKKSRAFRPWERSLV